MEERTSEALNRTTNVNADDTSYSTAMARGIVVGAALTPGSSALASGVIHLTAAVNAKSGVNIGNASGAAQHIGRAFFGVGGVAKKITKMLIGVPSVGHDLPSGYTELDSIEFTGTQSIDTGLPNTLDSRYEFGLVSTEQARSVIVGTAADDNNDFRIFNSSGNLYYDYGSERLTVTGAFPTGQRFDLAFGNFYCDMNGARVATGTTQTTFALDDTIKLSTGSQYDTAYAKFKFFYYRHYHGDTLVREFYPCRRESDGAIGLFDKVTNAFFGNDGTGTFTAGATVDGSRARLFFEALPDAVPIRVTNSDGQSSTQARYITYNGRNYSSAASFNANPGDTITVRVRGYNSQYSGKVTKNGARVYTQSSNALGSYTYTVPSSGSVTINLVQRSTTVSKTTYYYGEVTITEAT